MSNMPTLQEQLVVLDISLALVRPLHDRVMQDGLNPEPTLDAIALLATIKQTLERRETP